MDDSKTIKFVHVVGKLGRGKGEDGKICEPSSL